jgi:hypothetical protein
MANLNKGEYGQKVYVNMGEDVSSASTITFILEPQSGEKLERTTANGVAVGTTNLAYEDQTFIANEYLEYTILDGDLTYVGTWRLKGECLLTSTNKVISDYQLIEVLA